jgi:amidohydrolase
MKQRIEELFPQVVAWRRTFHQYPEVSFHEIETSKRVAAHLESLGLEVRTGVGGGGVTGLLRGHHHGPTIALRADMDALPIQDEKTCSYRSRIPGVMHACGHDGHMAMLMGAASILTTMKAQLYGNILFIFQHAEETLPGGAKSMIQAGVLEGVDAIYGIHLWSPLPTGYLSFRAGPMLASSDVFKVNIIGKGGHGGLPHTTTDAIAVASHAIVNIQSIISRQIDPVRSAVISIGSIHGGEASNVISDSCEWKGTVRAFAPDIREFLLRRIKEVVHDTCHMYGASYEIEIRKGYPPLITNPLETARLRKVGASIVGIEKVEEMDPLMGGEDFAYYLNEIPGTFCFVGAGNEMRGITAPHHHSHFDVDEEAMKVGLELLVKGALQYLYESSYEKNKPTLLTASM